MKHVKKRVKKHKARRFPRGKSEIISAQKLMASGRVPTHIPGFDILVGGGFEKNSTNLVVGGAGCGKTIFATQFLIEGMERGEKCLYVTFEEKKEEFYRNMLEINFDLKPYEKKGLFTFLEYEPSKIKVMLEEGGGAVESLILTKNIKRLVIDSITSFVLLFSDELEKREAALDLFSMINGWDCTCLLTYEESTLKEAGMPSTRALQFESDSITMLYFVRSKSLRQRFIEIIKMRGTKHSRSIHKFVIGKGGIKIKTKAISAPKVIW